MFMYNMQGLPGIGLIPCGITCKIPHQASLQSVVAFAYDTSHVWNPPFYEKEMVESGTTGNEDRNKFMAEKSTAGSDEFIDRSDDSNGSQEHNSDGSDLWYPTLRYNDEEI